MLVKTRHAVIRGEKAPVGFSTFFRLRGYCALSLPPPCSLLAFVERVFEARTRAGSTERRMNSKDERPPEQSEIQKQKKKRLFLNGG